MYLSKLTINTSCSSVYMNINNADNWHKKVMTGFKSITSKTPRKELGVLFRMYYKPSGIEILVQSLVEPNWSGKDWVLGYEVKDTSQVLNSLYEGQVLRFDVLCATYRKNRVDKDNDTKSNTGKTTEGSGGLRANARYLVTGAKAKEWLCSKGNSHGYRLSEDTLEVYDKYSTLQGISGSAKGCFLTRFTGTMVITDLDNFKRCYTEGIGREKAYGAGMLLLSR